MPPLSLTDLNNAKADVDHIADLATSPAEEATDRLGQTKKTWTGVLAELNAAFTISATGLNKLAAEAAASQAATNATAAQTAREQAQQFGGIYPDTAAALADAGLTDGKYFSTPYGPTGGYLQLWRKSGGLALPGKVSVSSENFSDLNGDPNVSTGTVDDSEEWAAEYITPAGVKRIASADILVAIITALTATTITTTGQATLAILSTIRKLIPTDDVGFLDEVKATIDDSEEWASFAVLNDGRIKIGTLVLNALQMLGSMSVPAATITAVQADSLNGASVEAVVAGATAAGPQFWADVEHNIGYSQSLGIGTGSTPALSTTQTHDSLKFDGGVRPLDGGTGVGGTGVRTSLVPLTETTNTLWGETASTAAAYAIKYLLDTEDGIAYTEQTNRQLFSQDGEGGKTITELMQDTYFQRVRDSVDAGLALSNASGWTYNAPAMMWNQGENDAVADTLRATYTEKMETMRLMVQAKVQAVTGQKNPLKMICMQTASHAAPSYNKPPTVPFAQYDAGNTYPHIRIAVPMYICTYNTADEIHLDAASERLIGYYWGIARKRIVNDRLDWKPLKPITFIKQGNVCRIIFHVPVGELMIDNALCATIANAGFNLYNAGGAVAITSVVKSGPDSVTIVGAGAWDEVRYATVGSTAGKSGKVNGPRGNLRDQQGDTIVINGNAMHNPCVIFGKFLLTNGVY